MHKAKTCIITCIDFRFQKKIHNYLKDNGYEGTCDEIIVAGASRDFIAPLTPEHGEYVWNQLNMSINLHSPDEIVFIDHQDCGGYAQDNTIPGDLPKVTDKQKHSQFMGKLQLKLQEKYPDKKVTFLYAPLVGEVEILKA